jgi:hypothetical protein
VAVISTAAAIPTGNDSYAAGCLTQCCLPASLPACLTLTFQFFSTSRLGLLRSRWMMGGLWPCRYSMPCSRRAGGTGSTRKLQKGGAMAGACLPACLQ